MYQVKINLGQLNTVLSCCNTEYVDILIRNKVMMVVNYTSQMFGCYLAECQSTKDASNDFSFRINRKLFQTLCDSVLQIDEFTDSEGHKIKITYLDEMGSVLYSDCFVKQVVFTSVYQDRLDLLGQLSSTTDVIDVGEIRNFVKLCKGVSGIINFSDNAACMEDNGLYICKEIDTKGIQFSVLADTFWTVSSLNSKIISIRNYIASTTGSVYLMATKCRFSSNDFLEQLEEMGSRYIADVDLSNVFLVSSKLKTDCNTFSIDLENYTCEIPVNLNKIIVHIKTENEHSQGANPVVQISAGVMKILCSNAKSGKLRLSVKKRFIKIEQNNLTIFTN